MDLPAGWTWRRATLGDVTAICDLVIAGDIAEYGEPDYEEADVREDFARERFDPERDTWAVHDAEGTLRVYAATWDKRPHELVLGDCFSDPAGPDLQPWLVARVTERAREHAAVAGRTTVHAFNAAPNARRARALTDAGYGLCRVFRRMVADLDAPPPDPAPGPGVTIRAVTPDDHPTCYRLVRESFRDHFDYSDESYDSWYARTVGSSPGSISAVSSTRRSGPPCSARRPRTTPRGWLPSSSVGPSVLGHLNRREQHPDQGASRSHGGTGRVSMVVTCTQARTIRPRATVTPASVTKVCSVVLLDRSPATSRICWRSRSPARAGARKSQEACTAGADSPSAIWSHTGWPNTWKHSWSPSAMYRK
jgi:hypothetical protein